jgi:hypothetical protein
LTPSNLKQGAVPWSEVPIRSKAVWASDSV